MQHHPYCRIILKGKKSIQGWIVYKSKSRYRFLVRYEYNKSVRLYETYIGNQKIQAIHFPVHNFKSDNPQDWIVKPFPRWWYIKLWWEKSKLRKFYKHWRKKIKI